MGIKQQDQHTNIWDTNGLIPHQSRVDSQTCPILGQTPTTYLFVFRQTMATTHRKRLDYTATSDTTNITSGHNPGVTSQTLTSGPLTRRRVIIHVEDHTPPPKPIGRQSTYRLLRTHQDSPTLMLYTRSYSPREVLRPIISSQLPSIHQRGNN